jgi:predicted small integral membrane protein
MNVRTIKIALSLSIALLCIFYAAQNIANLPQAHGAVAYVMSNAEHTVYPSSFGPTISHPTLHWLALGLIILGEFTAGFLALKGTWDLWSRRRASAVEFHSAKHFTVLGAGVALLVWFGLFHVIGGALFQQWQTTAGDMSLNGATWLAGLIGIITLFITQVEDDF